MIYEYLLFNKKNTLDYGVRISGDKTFEKPAKSTETITVPGRNGTLEIDNKRYENVNITYSAFIIDRFESNFADFAAYMLSQKGYGRLEDSYHPDHFRMARYSGGLSPVMTPRNKAGSFEISFDCKPQMFLRSGERTKEYETGQVIQNPTFFRALPLIRVYGTGSLTLNETVTVNTADGYTDIDCDAQEAFKGSVNCNGKITLPSGNFPYFAPAQNTLTFSGFSKVEITPRWWTL